MKRIVKFSVNGLTQTHNAAPFVSRSFDACPPSTCNVSALSRSTRDKFRYFAWPRVVTDRTDRSESRPERGREQWGKIALFPGNKGFFAWMESNLFSLPLSPDVNLAFTLVPSLPLNSFNSAYVRDGVHIEISWLMVKFIYDRGMIFLKREREKEGEKFLSSQL